MSRPQNAYERGVYVVPGVGVQGERSVVVVDSKNARRVELVVKQEQDIRHIINALWTALDKIDPPSVEPAGFRPHLRLLTA